MLNDKSAHSQGNLNSVLTKLEPISYVNEVNWNGVIYLNYCFISLTLAKGLSLSMTFHGKFSQVQCHGYFVLVSILDFSSLRVISGFSLRRTTEEMQPLDDSN